MSFTSINPTTGDTLATYAEMDLRDALTRVKKSHESFKSWKDTAFSLRASCMIKAAAKLKAEKKSLAKLGSVDKI